MNIWNTRRSFCILHCAFCILLLSATAVTADVPSPKEQADALVKEAQTLVKEKRFDDAMAAFEKAWSVEGLSQWDFDSVVGRARDAFTGSPSPEHAHRVCDAIVANSKVGATQRLWTMNWKARTARNAKKYAESREWEAKIRALPKQAPEVLAESFVREANDFLDEGATNAVKNAIEAYGKAFAVPELPRANLDGHRVAAVRKLSGKATDEARKIADQILADKETGAHARYDIHLMRATWAKQAKDEKSFYAETMAAAKVPGKFDRRQAYYSLAGYERDKGTWTRHDEPEHLRKYLEIMEQAYQAGVKEMGLQPEVAAETYLHLALFWLWHGGRPGVNAAKAREAFEKAAAAGATAKSGREHASFENVKRRLEDREAHEKLFAKFPNRNWRNEDGKIFAEIEKALDKGKKVHAKDFGWNPTNATEALQKAIDSDASVIIVDKMASPWEIEGITIPSCKKLLLRKGAVIEAREHGLIQSHSLVSVNGTNVIIVGEGGNAFRMRKNDYMTDKEHYPSMGDGRHGIEYTGSAPHGNLLVRNVSFVSTGGDGACIGRSKRTWFDKVEFIDNIRQGLTIGTGCDTLYLTKCKFNNTWGGEPMAGIDVENWTENCAICEIYCEDCEFADNRNYGLVLATSAWYSPITMLFKNCEFRNNMNFSVAFNNRPGVPTQNKEIFENCRFLQSAGTFPIFYERSLIGNLHFKDCLIQEVHGKGAPFVTRSPITVSLGRDMSDFFVGSNVFENVKVVGYKDMPLLSFSSATEYIKDGAFTGVIDFNGEKIDLAKYVKEMGYDKPAPEFKPEPLDFSKLLPPPLDGAVDAYTMAPYSGDLELIYWARAGRKIKLEWFNRITGWTWTDKERNFTVVKPDGTTEVVGPVSATDDFSKATYTVPEDGFYRFRGRGGGFWVTADDKIWGYSYRSVSGNFANFSKDVRFTGFFEVPKGLKEITIQTGGCESFELADANGKLVAQSGPAGFKTWKCKVDAPGVWSFRILNGSIRFFSPLNGIFASCPENLPRIAP